MNRRHDTGGRGRMAAWLLAVALVVPAVTAAGSASAGAAPAAGLPPWTLKLAIQYLPPPGNHSQYDVVLAWPGQAWFLGGTNVGGHGKPKAERIISGSPQSVPLPAGPHSWITAASAPAPNDIWAVTFLGGSVLNWNGTAWQNEPRGGWKAGTRFTGITAISKTDVWVFGTRGHLHPGAGTWHFSGTRWKQVTGVAAGIFQASAAGKSDIWGVGNAGHPRNALFRLGGSVWRRVRPAALAGFTYTRVLALSPANVWVAGLVAGVPKLGHFDGHHWTRLQMPGTVAGTGMCRDGRGGLWVIANTGTSPSVVLNRSSGGTWKKAKVSRNAADQVLACALVPGTVRAWGAGKATAPQGSAAAAYRTG